MSTLIQGADSPQPSAGDPLELSSWGNYRWWSGGQGRDLCVHEVGRSPNGRLQPGYDPETNQWQLGLEWEEPRDVRQVRVRFAGPVPADVQVQYWRMHWPTPAPERFAGARHSWIGRDDPYHGEWTTVRGASATDEGIYSFVCDPIDLPEIGLDQVVNAEHYRVDFRRTLKLRIVGAGSLPDIVAFHAYSGSVWREGEIDLLLGVGQSEACDWSGFAEVWNGHLLDIRPVGFAESDRIMEDARWSLETQGRPKGVRLRLLYADCESDSGDRTIVTVRTEAHSFSVLVSDLAEGSIYIRDLDALVYWAGEAPDLQALESQIALAPQPIYDRVAEEPEQSLERAMQEMPALDETITAPFGRYFPLGVEAGRQEWALRYNGELFADKRLLKLWGRDAARLQWPGAMLRFRVGSGDPPDFRERRKTTQQSRLEGWLPIFCSEWLDREISYSQTAFAALLDGPMTPPDERRGDEDLVVMMRIKIRNTTPGRKRARLWIVNAPQEELKLEKDCVVATGRIVPAEPVARQWRIDAYPSPCLRYALTPGKGTASTIPCALEPGESHSVRTAVAYDVDLGQGEMDVLDLAVPFVSLTRRAEWEKVRRLGYAEKLDDVIGYWRDYVESGGKLSLPDKVLADFHKAVRTHIAISVDKDPVSGLCLLPAATWAYHACGNEACWQIEMLDQAGHHDRAESYLETFLRTQGLKELDGAFSSAEGALTALELDAGEPKATQFSYNLDHGVIMECLAAHYRYTGDRDWLSRVAPNLVAACDFVIRERQNTKRTDPDGEADKAWGLLPAGHLEDNREWRHWFAVNAHAHRGMKEIAQVLAEIGCQDADRLRREVALYQEDIQRAARRAMIEAPVVRLMDGTYIPHLPTRTGIRGREWGWFREAGYGALHLLEGHVFPPDAQEMTWVLQDLEDNLYMSREWGRPVDVERLWFSQGGITIQPNVTDLAIDYMRRGQTEHAIRALYNNYGQQLYPDVRVFTEHPVTELGHGIGPFYKPSDESKALVWLRACLVWEDGDTLHLAPAAPRDWFLAGQSFGVERMATFFGPLSYQVEATESEVSIRVEAPSRRPLAALVVHVRRPGAIGVCIDGEPYDAFDVGAEQVCVRHPSGTLHMRVAFSEPR